MVAMEKSRHVSDRNPISQQSSTPVRQPIVKIENWATVGGVLSEIIGARTNSKNRKQFRQLGSSKIIKNGAIRRFTYDFLFDLRSIYMPI